MELSLVLELADVLKVALHFIEAKLPDILLIHMEIYVLESYDQLLTKPICVRICSKIRILLEGRIVRRRDERALPDVADDDVERLRHSLLVCHLIVVRRRVIRGEYLRNIPRKVHQHLIVLLQGCDPAPQIVQLPLDPFRFPSLGCHVAFAVRFSIFVVGPFESL